MNASDGLPKPADVSLGCSIGSCPDDGAWAAFVPSVADDYRWEQSYAQLACTLIVCLLLVLNGKLDAVISGWEIKTRRHPSEVSVPVVLILCAFLS